MGHSWGKSLIMFTLIIVAIFLATASSAHGEEREAKQFWPNTPQSSPLIYQTLPQHHQYPIHYPVGFGFGGVTQRFRKKVTGTLKSKTVTPAIQKFRLHSQKNKPATSTYNNNNFETLFWFLDKNGDDELSRNEFMGLALMAEEYVDPAEVLEIMRFTDQNYDNAIQHWEFIEAMEYFQEANELDYDY